MNLRNCIGKVAPKLGVILRAKLHESVRIAIGNREIVGYGINGEPIYVDHFGYPFSAIRFKESTPDFLALREKEKGDWKLLSFDEKKCLYRCNYCQTLAEMNAPTGEWKFVLGGVLMVVTFGLWLHVLLHIFVYQKFCPLPESFSEESKRAQLRRMLDLRVNPIHGISSKWDYDRDCWKT